MTTPGKVLFAIAGLTFVVTAWASNQIYRCTQGGKTTLTDHPCNSTAESSGASTRTTPTASLIPEQSFGQSMFGEWRGPIQSHAVSGGSVVPDDHAVVPFTLKIAADGTFTGAAPELGCKFLGIATPFPGVPTAMQLDVTATGCKLSVLNARYQGNLARQTPTNVVLTLSAVYTISPSHMVIAELKSTLRR